MDGSISRQAEGDHEDLQSLGWLLRSAHRAMVRGLAAELAPHGITNGEWSALRVLWRGDGLTQVELAERLVLEKASLTPVIASLERKQLITRRQDMQDRRKSRILLTEAGRGLRGRVRPLGEVVNRRAQAGLDADEQAALHDMLRRVIAVISPADGGTEAG